MNEAPFLTLQRPNGEQAQPRHSSVDTPQLSYEPPSRETVAEVVRVCAAEIGNRALNGESFGGVLLREASVQLYWDRNTDFHKIIFPQVLLTEVLTEHTIQSSLDFDRVEARGYDLGVSLRLIRGDNRSNDLGKFARVFAVLLLCDTPQHIFGFFTNGLNDDDFPFQAAGTYRKDIQSKSRIRGARCFQPGWTSQSCESFLSVQWRVFLPFFVEGGHHVFEEDRIMPWHDYHIQATRSKFSTSASTSDGNGALGGAHSDVSRVVIHEGHCGFDGYDQVPGSQRVVTFAVKRLKTTKEVDFNKEVAMLRNLGGKEHTVKLLATFHHGQTYSLLFPWAECDLLAYWERGHSRGMSRKLAFWIATQCCGLISALSWMHNPQVLDPDKEKLYARHGDIKPENILWYKGNSDDPLNLAAGRLVFSDFGLSSLNHKDTRSNIMNGNILNTTTYAPPESILPDHKISRSIDIWALGCVYLEFVTWIVGGLDFSFVLKFERERLAPFLGSQISNYVFWEVQESDSAQAARRSPEHVTVVKPQVTKWIKYLRTRPQATQFIQDLLSIIENDMLVIKKEDRTVARKLVPMFDRIKRACDRDLTYYTTPAAHVGSIIIQQPVIHNLSIEALEVIRRPGSMGLPRFTGVAAPPAPTPTLVQARSGAALLKPPT